MNIKITLTSLLLVLTITCSYAQDKVINKGDHLVSLSTGIFNPEAFTFDILGFSGSGDPSPSLNLHYQYSLSDRVALGAYGSFYRVDASYVNSIENLLSDFSSDLLGDVIGGLACTLLGNCADVEATERVSVFTAGGSLTYHTQWIDKVDTYATTYLGYSFNRRKSFTAELLDLVVDQTGLGVKIPNVVYYTGVGARYFVSPNFAIYGEAGYGNSHLFNLGLSYKFATFNTDSRKRNRV